MIVHLKDGDYFKKKLDERRFLNEVVSHEIANKVGLQTPSFKYVQTEDEFIYLSKDFKEKGKEYVQGYYYSPMAYSLPFIYDSISSYEKFLNTLEEPNASIFLLQVLKMSLFDAFREEQDRSGRNYFFEKDHYENMILLDHSECFFGKGRYFISNQQFSLVERKSDMVTYLKKYKELYKFLEKLIAIDMEALFKEIMYRYDIEIRRGFQNQYMDEVKKTKKVFHGWAAKV